ncbi:MAG: hypothetical protein ACRDLB_05325 [Actinomycetota bacterium]
MRERFVTLLALLLIALAATFALLPAAALAGGGAVVAQEGVDESDESQGGETRNREGGEGQSDPDAETGAGEGENAPAAEEEGPVWTYQMSKILIALLVFMAIAVGLAYYKLVVQRQRAGI